MVQKETSFIKHGFGEMNSASGFKYLGEWKNGHQTGQAKIFYKNDDWYQGFVKNGIRNGFGELHEQSSKRFFSDLLRLFYDFRAGLLQSGFISFHLDSHQ